MGLAGDIAAVSLPVYNYYLLLSNDDEEGKIEFYKSFLATVVTTYALKYSVKEQRPDRSDNNSFPSSHTSVAFNSATNIALRYGFKEAIYTYAGAAFVAFSRIYEKKHYPVDVAAGALIGMVSSYIFTTKYHSSNIELSYSDHRYFIKYNYNF